MLRVEGDRHLGQHLAYSHGELAILAIEMRALLSSQRAYSRNPADVGGAAVRASPARPVTVFVEITSRGSSAVA